MSILTLEGVVKRYDMKPLLEGVTFSLEPSEKMGVIGPNGSGKTTLLRIIAGVEPADEGRVWRSNDARIAYLPQQPAFDETMSVLDAVFDQGDPVMRRLHDYEEAVSLLNASGGMDEALIERVSDLGHELEVAGGWELEAHAEAILGRLGITDTAALVGTLSGGQRKRVAMARALILRPDLLILDEPTNHLDAETIAWLESYLARMTSALLLVTHDRYFLDRVTNNMLELERGRTHRFQGNYSYYLEKKAEREEQRATEEQKRQGLMRQELAWLRRGAKARTTKQKARVDRAHALLDAPREAAEKELKVSAASSRLGNKVFDLAGISKAYDDQILIADFSHTFEKGDRIGIIGPNGTGKTTLLDIIAGAVQPDAGVVDRGQTVVLGYYDQESRALKDDLRAIEYIKEVAEVVKTADGDVITAGQMMERFLFPPATQYAYIASLSGGERRRLYLLHLLMGAPNVLLLDEPTNDFDLPTLIALEHYLDAFDGCLIVVSHDRYFLDRTVEHIFSFEEEGRIKAYPGNYAAYLEQRGRADREAAAAAKKKVETATPEKEKPRDEPRPRKLSYKERLEFEALETRIAEAEQRKAQLAADLETYATDFARIQTLYEELGTLDRQLELDLERWAELGELAQ
ncbi:MAG: ABC-F family ATP-binding cassette domain-containing protein [Rhodothermales bacterium]